MRKQAFDRLAKAGKNALSSVQRAGGLESDPDLSFYKTLKEEDFARIAKQYGPDGLVQYITAMETRGIKGGS